MDGEGRPPAKRPAPHRCVHSSGVDQYSNHYWPRGHSSRRSQATELNQWTQRRRPSVRVRQSCYQRQAERKPRRCSITEPNSSRTVVPHTHTRARGSVSAAQPSSTRHIIHSRSSLVMGQSRRSEISYWHTVLPSAACGIRVCSQRLYDTCCVHNAEYAG